MSYPSAAAFLFNCWRTNGSIKVLPFTLKLNPLHSKKPTCTNHILDNKPPRDTPCNQTVRWKAAQPASPSSYKTLLEGGVSGAPGLEPSLLLFLRWLAILAPTPHLARETKCWRTPGLTLEDAVNHLRSSRTCLLRHRRRPLQTEQFPSYLAIGTAFGENYVFPSNNFDSY